ncbi:ArsR family transcriptional regulator [Haloquadratum walsbyi]|uniref:ArsR family transcriptional regulator n=1 Tax=Haloquadratum walsbyi TaxID=293091 RepID=UPI0015F78307|nr:ArsR family transcriptional regulator [Haloquadratum walsbyi]
MSTSVVDPENAVQLSKSEFRSRLRELPPSAKLVVKVLETDSPLSQGQLAEESRYALSRLEENELIGSRYSFKDARKQVYFLNDHV